MRIIINTSSVEFRELPLVMPPTKVCGVNSWRRVFCTLVLIKAFILPLLIVPICILICCTLYCIYMCARLKLSYQSRLELSVGNEVLRIEDDRRLVSAVPLRDRTVCTSLVLCICWGLIINLVGPC